jgi:hypothetical protein
MWRFCIVFIEHMRLQKAIRFQCVFSDLLLDKNIYNTQKVVDVRYFSEGRMRTLKIRKGCCFLAAFNRAQSTNVLPPYVCKESIRKNRIKESLRNHMRRRYQPAHQDSKGKNIWLLWGMVSWAKSRAWTNIRKIPTNIRPLVIDHAPTIGSKINAITTRCL